MRIWHLLVIHILTSLVFNQRFYLHAQTTNHCVEFDGEYAYLKLRSDNAIKPTNQLTLELFAWEDDWTAEEYTPTLAGNTQHAGYAIAIFLGKLYGCVLFDSTLQPHNLYYNLSLLTPGWHHFALTYDGISSRLLVDGEVVAMLSNDKPTPIAQPDSSILFMVGAETRYNGEPYMHPAFFFKGRIDDMRIWNIAKTPEQIRNGFLVNQEPETPNLMASFTFDTLVKQTLFDVGKFGVHAQLMSGTRLVPSNSPRTNWLFASFTQLKGVRLYQTILLLLIVLGLLILVYYLSTLGLKGRLWLVGFLVLSVLNAMAGHWALYELIVPDTFVPFWNLKVLYAVYLLSISCLLQFLMLTFQHTHLFTLKRKEVVQFIPFIPAALAINALAVPVVFSKFVIVLISLLVLGAILFYAHVQSAYSVYLYAGAIAIFIGSILFILPLIGVIGNIVKTPNDFFTLRLIELIAFGLLAIKVRLPAVSESVIPVSISDSMIDAPQIQSLLSKREWEVYQLLVIGNTDKEIADQLFISLNTVKTHIKKIYQKLDVRNRMEAAALSKK
jgi:DNA-binding CsgD family transcriptional regulator